jgi:outer membrane protein assembly factor BamE (lipoprotein component of BamABCDE complex)
MSRDMKQALLVLLLLGAAACSPYVATRGNLVDPDDLKTVTIGTSTKQDVRTALGTPTSTEPLNDNVWYYVGQKTERYGFRKEKLTERRIVAAQFDENGVLQTLTPIENSGRDIAMVARATPTSGHNLTVLQQFFGNLGRFNSKDTGVAGAAPGDGIVND